MQRSISWLVYLINNLWVTSTFKVFSLVCDRQVALAPLSSFEHFDAIFRILTPFSNPIEVRIHNLNGLIICFRLTKRINKLQSFLEFFQTGVILDSDVVGKRLFDIACEQTYTQARFCRDVFIFVCGPNRNNLDPVWMTQIWIEWEIT